jgi:GMP synthase-like glutamine amidotransferase
MMISEALGDSPALREVEFYPEPTSKIEFEDWIVSVSSREGSGLSPSPCPFTRLLRQCEEWDHVRVQYLWHGDFDEDLVSAEPRPMCAFLSGSSLEWCQRSREPWRGVQQVLARRNLPMWGACGGAQILPILEETGVDKPWDCPRCRDPENPKLPVYSHIGHTGEAKCGDYSKNIGERGKFKMRIIAKDPVLEGLPEVFEIMESHIGQIAYVPDGWVRVVTKGPGAHTVNQCIRVKDRYIYAAQFHMELPGTPENSRKIISNFLSLAKGWGGYNPDGAPVREPKKLRAVGPQ